MSDTQRTLERELERPRPPRIAFEQLEIRRDHKRRNQRVAAGVLGVAVFAVALIGLVRLLGSERHARERAEPRAEDLNVHRDRAWRVRRDPRTGPSVSARPRRWSGPERS